MIDATYDIANQTYDNWHVLIVDDEADNRMVAKSVLEFHGATVYTASGAKDGFTQLEKHPVNLLLLDLAMPGITGWDMLETLQQDDNFKLLPVIAITAHAMSGDKERVLDAGFTGYIPKPYDATTLAEQIRAALQSASQIAEDTPTPDSD